MPSCRPSRRSVPRPICFPRKYGSNCRHAPGGEPSRLAAPDPAGDAGLREAIARLVCAPRGLRYHPDQVVIVPTATAAIDLIAAALLRPGDVALVERPGRAATKRLLEARGARLHAAPLRLDDRGGHALAPCREARLACIAPAVQFPLCTTLDASSRAQLTHWARTSGGWIIEDDRDSDLWSDDAHPIPLAAEDGERVVLVGSFNRILFPDLCAAFLIAPAARSERLRAMHALIGGRASLASQLALREFIGEGHFARHIRRRRQAYAERRAVLIEALAKLALPSARGAMPASTFCWTCRERRPFPQGWMPRGLGGVAIDETRLALGLGAGLDTIRGEASRVAAAILQISTDTRGIE